MNDPDRPAQETAHDPFALLGLPRRFDLSQDQLESAFLARVSATHPDLAGDEAAVDAAALTTAHATLADPEQRAAALLSLLGGPNAAQDRSLPDSYLPEIMQLRAEIEEELAEDPDAARARWTKRADERRDAHIAQVNALFQAHHESPDTALLRAIRTELNAWRYTERLIEQLDPGYDPADADFRGPGA